MTIAPATITLPSRVWLTRKDVLAAVGGRRQLDLAEQTGRLRREMLTGYKIAHYKRAEVARYLAEVGGFHIPS